MNIIEGLVALETEYRIQEKAMGINGVSVKLVSVAEKYLDTRTIRVSNEPTQSLCELCFRCTFECFGYEDVCAVPIGRTNWELIQ